MRIPILILPICSLSLGAAGAIAPPTGITAAISAPADEAAAFALHAEGEHVFECRPLASNPDRFGWSFTAPDATLYDAGRPVARHVAQDVFEAIGDRSTVSASPRSRQDGGPSSIPWLLMRAQATPDAGLFAGITSVQRVNTAGGVAPDTGCDVSNVGKEARVPFRADYYFYRRNG